MSYVPGTPMQPQQPQLETDPRFPSGRWIGFFLQTHMLPGKYQMEMELTFANGDLTGEGRDFVGKFLMRGTYDLNDGRCTWHKRYLGGHDIYYKGFNEGKGIWGTWELTPAPSVTGGFHIWPESMGDPSEQTLEEQADLPIIVEENVKEFAPVGAPDDGEPDDIRF
ncbi:MAG: hypothetical protein ACFCD0_12535 [Gemmataceae bacterium]